VGVQLTEYQKNQIKSFMEVNDVASAQKVILGELETQFGGMAEAAGDTAAGAMAQMKNALGDTAEVIGSLLAPAVTNIAKGINSFANAISESLEPQKEQLTQTQLSKIEIQRLGRVLEIYSEKEKLTANETQHRADTIRKLNKLSPKYLGHLDSEKTAYEDIEDAIRSATTHLKEQIKVEAGREVLLETNKEILSIERKIMDIERSLTEGSADLAIAYDWQASKAERVAAATRLGYEYMDLLDESTVIHNNLTNQAAVSTELFAEDMAKLVEQQIKLEEETQELLSRMPELATFFNKLTEENAILTEGITNQAEAIDIYLVKLVRFTQGWENLIKLVPEQVLPELDKLDDGLGKLMDGLDREGQFAVNQMQKLGGSMAQAAIYGQDMGESVTSALKAMAVELAAQLALWAALNTFMPGASAAAGLRGVGGFFNMLFGHSGGFVTDQGIQKFAGGGTVMGGDTVPALLQSGEFVLSRSAVQDIGVDTAQRINQGGGTGITVNIHGGIVQDDYIRNELLPAISRAEEMGA
jgi:hypothetical protein